MILAKTWYKIYNSEFLAIIEVFKIWKHYLKICKHEVLIFINHSNLQQFLDLKYLSFVRSVKPRSSFVIIFKSIIV